MEDLEEEIRRGPALSRHQQAVLHDILHFVEGSDDCLVFQGSAGTGKTTLLATLVKELNQRHRAFLLLAPTGRAARILGNKTAGLARTIHSVIYDMDKVQVFEEAKSSNDPGIRFHFPLSNIDPADVLFIVDEASMVGDKVTRGDYLRFGSGRLLADLVEYSRLGRFGRDRDKVHAQLLFVGDPAQLPPVMERISPALSAKYLEHNHDLRCTQVKLTKVMRQGSGSSILQHATQLRDAILEKRFNTFKISPDGLEISSLPIPEAIDFVVGNLTRHGVSSSVLVARSNARVLALNQAVRARLWGEDTSDLRSRDILLVVKNSPPLFNGDLIKVVEVSGETEVLQVPIKGVDGPIRLAFRDVSVVFRKDDGEVLHLECKIIENLLDSPEGSLKPVEQRALLVDFRQRYPNLQPGTQEFKLAITTDPWFNALQVKYGYAMTCHKAQGGEWEACVVDFAGQGGSKEDFFRWTYTAITRARSRLITLSAPAFDEYTSMDWGDGAVPRPIQSRNDSSAQGERDISDWDRFAFSSEYEDLYDYHQALSDAWKESDISVVRLNHLPYCEQYTLQRSRKQARGQYWYKGDHRVSKVAELAGPHSDRQLTEDVVSIMRDVLLGGDKREAAGETEFMKKFREKVQLVLSGSDIRLLSSKPREYCLRFEFEMDGERTVVDFFHDETPKWTSVKSVGVQPDSGELMARLKSLLGDNP